MPGSQDHHSNQSTVSTANVINGAFSALAVADGRSAVDGAVSLEELTGVAVEILDDGDSTVAEIVERDGCGVPSPGNVVRVRVHQRGSSALITVLGGVLDDCAVTSAEVATVLRVLLDGESSANLISRFSSLGARTDGANTVGVPSTDTNTSGRVSARGTISTEIVDPISACIGSDTGYACAAVLSATVGGQVTVVDNSCRTVVSVGDISWPAVPKTILETTASSPYGEADATPEVSVIVRPSPTVRRGRRELEWRSPEYRHETCSVTIEQGPRGVKLTARTVDSFDPAQVVGTLIRVFSEWAVDLEREVDRPTVRSLAMQDSGEIDPLGGELVGEVEELLAAQLCRVLGLNEGTVGGDDNFFRLGGDSMGALTLSTALGEQGWTLDVQDVFQCPNVRSLAKKMSHISASSVREGGEGSEGEAEGTFVVAPASDHVSAPMSASGLDAATLAALVGDNSSASPLAGDKK